MQGSQEINLRANILSEFIKNHVMHVPKELSTLQLDKKHLRKRHRIFRRDCEPSRIPARTHNVRATMVERLGNLFLLLTNEFIRWSTPK